MRFRGGGVVTFWGNDAMWAMSNFTVEDAVKLHDWVRDQASYNATYRPRIDLTHLEESHTDVGLNRTANGRMRVAESIRGGWVWLDDIPHKDITVRLVPRDTGKVIRLEEIIR